MGDPERVDPVFGWNELSWARNSDQIFVIDYTCLLHSPVNWSKVVYHTDSSDRESRMLFTGFGDR